MRGRCGFNALNPLFFQFSLFSFGSKKDSPEIQNYPAVSVTCFCVWRIKDPNFFVLFWTLSLLRYKLTRLEGYFRVTRKIWPYSPFRIGVLWCQQRGSGLFNRTRENFEHPSSTHGQVFRKLCLSMTNAVFKLIPQKLFLVIELRCDAAFDLPTFKTCPVHKCALSFERPMWYYESILVLYVQGASILLKRQTIKYTRLLGHTGGCLKVFSILYCQLQYKISQTFFLRPRQGL